MIYRSLLLIALYTVAAACGDDAPTQAPVRTPTSVNENQYSVTESGLKYYDLVVGSGALPQAGERLVVGYTLWVQGEATHRQSTLDNGVPFRFTPGVDNVIAGFAEGVSSIRVGGQRQLVIPPELGYGDAGSGGIPGNATLIFEIELLAVE